MFCCDFKFAESVVTTYQQLKTILNTNQLKKAYIIMPYLVGILNGLLNGCYLASNFFLSTTQMHV